MYRILLNHHRRSSLELIGIKAQPAYNFSTSDGDVPATEGWGFLGLLMGVEMPG